MEYKYRYDQLNDAGKMEIRDFVTREGSYMDAVNQEIRSQLSVMIAQARSEGKWLWTAYQDLWFTPDQLQQENNEGRFLWDVCNWKLRDPMERVIAARKRLHDAGEEYERILRLLS